MQKLIVGVLGNLWFFFGTLAFFVLYATFIALSNSQLLAFDEGYHFALTNYYSYHLSPIINAQPEELSLMGDATRLGSYLSHYLLSFPLRLVQFVGGELPVQIAVLRLINIALVAAALVLFRKFVITLTGKTWIANSAVLLYCALPVTSYLAANINYDNLPLLCFALVLLFAQSIMKAVDQGRLSLHQLLPLMSTLMIGCLVKFTFLPIATAVGVFVVTFIGVRRAKLHKTRIRYTSVQTRLGYTTAISLCIISAGLFAERYGGNAISYGTLQPDCAAVQELKTCLNYGPWARNYTLEQNAKTDLAFEGRSIQGYVANIWAPLMIKGLGYAGINNTLPRIVVYLLAMIIGSTIIGLSALLFMRKDRITLMILLATLIYFLALLQRNYSEFMQFHEVVAVQGRYALPFMIPLFAMGLVGLKMYIIQINKIPRAYAAFSSHIQTIDPDKAYEYSKNYWASKISDRRLASD